MTTVDFYFNADDRLQVACRLAGKAYAQKKRLLVHAPDAELAARIDKMLWTWQAIGFVPHCAAHDPLASETPILIGSADNEEMSPYGCDILLNLDARCPPHFERPRRISGLALTNDHRAQAAP